MVLRQSWPGSFGLSRLSWGCCWAHFLWAWTSCGPVRSALVPPALLWASPIAQLITAETLIAASPKTKPALISCLPCLETPSLYRRFLTTSGEQSRPACCETANLQYHKYSQPDTNKGLQNIWRLLEWVPGAIYGGNAWSSATRIKATQQIFTELIYLYSVSLALASVQGTLADYLEFSCVINHLWQMLGKAETFARGCEPHRNVLGGVWIRQAVEAGSI